MEKLLDEQKEALKELQTFVNNYKKASKERKTDLKYLVNRLDELAQWWSMFESRDTEIGGFKTENADQPYFVQNTFDDALKIYNEHRNNVMKQMEIAKTSRPNASSRLVEFNALEFDSNEDDSENETQTTGNECEFRNYIRAAQNVTWNTGSKALKLHLSDLVDVFNQITSLSKEQKASNGFLTVQAELLKSAWNDFRSKHNTEREKENEQAAFFDFKAVQLRYTECFGKLNDLKTKKTIELEKCKLPALTIPEFTGKPTEWFGFISLFDEAVHKQDISDSKKIQFLKTLVKGDAGKIIKHIAPTGENYGSCYKLLRTRYDNKRALLGKMLDTIFSLPKHKFESSENLKNLHDTVNECMLAIKNIGVQTKYWDPIINHIILKKLSPETVKNYECQLNDIRGFQSFGDVLKYLESRFLALQAAETKYDSSEQKVSNWKPNISTSSGEVKRSQCNYCKDQHKMQSCDKYLKLNIQERINTVKINKLCNNCLGNSHESAKCPSKYTCKHCGKKHHSSLHIESKNATPTKVTSSNVTFTDNQESHVTAEISANLEYDSEDVLLATALVQSRSKNNELFLFRALIDQGSQRSFITEDAVQALGLKKYAISLRINGIAGITKYTKSFVRLTVFPRFDSNFQLEIKAIVLDTLTNIELEENIITNYNHLQNLKLADPNMRHQNNVDILLGTIEFSKIVKEGLVKGNLNEPIAQNTEFGWIVSGPTNRARRANQINVHVLTLDQKLARFFDSDDINDEQEMTSEERMCEEHYEKHVQRDETGKYIVALPFKENEQEPTLGNSRKVAIASLTQLEKRFKRKPELKIAYVNFLTVNFCSSG